MKKIFANFLIVVGFLLIIPHPAFGQKYGGGQGSKTQVKQVLSAEEIADRFLPGVTLIICDDGKGNYSQGSGFFIAPGMILTNAHVVKGMVRGVAVTGKEQKKNLINAVAYFNSENTDLALLVSDEAKKVKTPILPLAQPKDLRIGETIYVLGNPEGLVGTISQGIISSGIRKIKNKDFLQITAPISAGSSGGAVMNARGEVVGIATSSLESGQNLNFAVPAARIGQFLDEFLTLPSPPEYVTLNKITGSWIAPQSFWYESAKTKNNLPSSTKNNEQPTLKEISNWLINKISGMRGYMNDNNFFEYKNVSINGCDLSYNELQIDRKGSIFLIYSYSSINLRTLDSVSASPDTSNSPFVTLNFNEKVVEKVAFYRNGYDKLTTPDSTGVAMKNSVGLFTGSQITSKQITNVINDLVKLCKE